MDASSRGSGQLRPWPLPHFIRLCAAAPLPLITCHYVLRALRSCLTCCFEKVPQDVCKFKCPLWSEAPKTCTFQSKTDSAPHGWPRALPCGILPSCTPPCPWEHPLTHSLSTTPLLGSSVRKCFRLAWNRLSFQDPGVCFLHEAYPDFACPPRGSEPLNRNPAHSHFIVLCLPDQIIGSFQGRSRAHITSV